MGVVCSNLRYCIVGSQILTVGTAEAASRSVTVKRQIPGKGLIPGVARAVAVARILDASRIQMVWYFYIVDNEAITGNTIKISGCDGGATGSQVGCQTNTHTRVVSDDRRIDDIARWDLKGANQSPRSNCGSSGRGKTVRIRLRSGVGDDERPGIGSSRADKIRLDRPGFPIGTVIRGVWKVSTSDLVEDIGGRVGRAIHQIY